MLNAGWMTFDGARALTVGDYVTPQTGEYAGQLGPWSKLVQIIGIEPRSTLMKLIFVGYGVASIVIAICFALKISWAWWGMLIIAVLGLWYLPIGTVVNIIVLVFLLLTETKG
jgi:hypothetical protein